MAVDNIDDIMPSDDAVAGNGYDADIEDADGGELYEHFRFVADKGQQLLRVDKFLVARIEKLVFHMEATSIAFMDILNQPVQK